ncbi:MAG: phage shock protein PspA [Opitutales bacterium]
MGIFSRFRDIVSANLNAMLERAEDPEKLIKLMIQEMEDTLVELKASCAGAMANRARLSRALATARERAEGWEKKARLAVEKGREDLAREALAERRSLLQEVEARESEMAHFEELIEQYQSDIRQLEEKLASARNKHRILVQRHIHASSRKQAQTKIRKADTSDAFVRFEQFEARIDRMEADADLVNYGRPSSKTLEDEFTHLERDEDIEKELASLKESVQKKPASE